MTISNIDKLQQLNLFYLSKFEELKTESAMIFSAENAAKFSEIEKSTLEIFLIISAQVVGIIFSEAKGDIDRTMRDYTSLSAATLKILYDSYAKIKISDLLKKETDNN
jgi:hypothetical protein